MLDAVAGKLAQVSLLTFFLVTDSVAFAHVPLWFFAVIVGRDVLRGIGTLLVRKRRGDVAVVSEVHGKLASAMLSCSCSASPSMSAGTRGSSR